MTSEPNSKTAITPVEIGAPNHPEAPAIVFTKLYGTVTDKDGVKQVSEFNITTRSNSPEEALELMFRGAEYAKNRFHLSLAKPDVSVPAPAKTTQSPAPVSPVSPSVPPVTPGGAVPSQPGIVPDQNIGLIMASRMEVCPEQGNKVTLKWYEKNHKFPDIYTKRELEKIMTLLMSTGEGWTVEHLRLPTTYEVKHEIRWRNSENKNSKGNPYKDIVAIRSL